MQNTYWVLKEHDFLMLDTQDCDVFSKNAFALPCRIEAYSSNDTKENILNVCENENVNCCYVFEEYNDFFNLCMNRIKKIITYVECRRGSEDYAFCALTIKKYLHAVHCVKKQKE